jgi:hypothetical protein
MVFPGEKNLGAMHNRMTVSKGIYMAVYDNTLPDQLRVFKIITALYIVSDVIAEDYFLGIPRKIYVRQNIHIQSQ